MYSISNLIILAILIGQLVFSITMLAHILTHPIKHKLIWFLVVLITQIIGALIYYFTEHKQYHPH
jgi:hypothetical protein